MKRKCQPFTCTVRASAPIGTLYYSIRLLFDTLSIVIKNNMEQINRGGMYSFYLTQLMLFCDLKFHFMPFHSYLFIFFLSQLFKNTCNVKAKCINSINSCFLTCPCLHKQHFQIFSLFYQSECANSLSQQLFLHPSQKNTFLKISAFFSSELKHILNRRHNPTQKTYCRTQSIITIFIRNYLLP